MFSIFKQKAEIATSAISTSELKSLLFKDVCSFFYFHRSNIPFKLYFVSFFCIILKSKDATEDHDFKHEL